MNSHDSRVFLYRQSSLRNSISSFRPAALLMLVLLGILNEALHQVHQFLLCDILATETLLEGGATLVQSANADKAGYVDHATCNSLTLLVKRSPG